MMHLITGKKGMPHVTAENHGFIYSRMIGKDKFVFDYGHNFEAVKVSNNNIQIRSGQGMMNGRHFEIEEGQTESVSIDSGTVGQNRNDLIVARYSKAQNGTESLTLTVIKGTPSSTPTDPAYIDGDILEGDTTVDFPLYRLNLIDTDIDSIEQLFEIIDVDVTETVKEIAELSEEVQELIDSQVVDKDYVPTLYSGAGTPPETPSSLSPDEEPKYGDLFISHYYGENFKLYVLNEIARHHGTGTITHLGWEEIPLASALTSALNNKLDRIVGIKTFFGSSEPSNVRANYDGLLSGDIYFEGSVGNNRWDGNIRKVYIAYISDNNENLVFWRELTTSQSGIWNNYYTKSDANDLLDDKLDREDGIKVFTDYTGNPPQSYVPSTNVSDWDGIKGGDILYTYYNSGAQNPRDIYIWKIYIASVFSGQMFWTEIAKGDLSTKQDTLTAGNNITIDANDTISYQEAEWELLKTVEATEDNPLGEIVWQASDLVNGTYDDIMVKATNVQGNTMGNYAFQCKTTANQYNSGLFGVLLASGLSSTVARNFFTKIERLNNTTEFELTSWYIDNYLNKEQSVIHTAPDLVATNPSHKLYYIRFYFSSTNTIKSGTFKIYGRKRIYGTTAQTLNSPLNLNREEINLDGTLPDELEGGLVKNVETDVSDTELNEIDDSEVEKDVSEIEEETKIDNSETEIEPEKVEKIDKK